MCRRHQVYEPLCLACRQECNDLHEQAEQLSLWNAETGMWDVIGLILAAAAFFLLVII